MAIDLSVILPSTQVPTYTDADADGDYLHAPTTVNNKQGRISRLLGAISDKTGQRILPAYGQAYDANKLAMATELAKAKAADIAATNAMSEADKNKQDISRAATKTKEEDKAADRKAEIAQHIASAAQSMANAEVAIDQIKSDSAWNKAELLNQHRAQFVLPRSK